MRIVIAGAGEVGTHLAKMLSNEEQDIIVIDKDEKKLHNLDNYNLMTMQGSALSLDALKSIQVGAADIFIAVTPHETINVIACSMAKSLGCKKAVARIDNYDFMTYYENKYSTSKGLDMSAFQQELANWQARLSAAQSNLSDIRSLAESQYEHSTVSADTRASLDQQAAQNNAYYNYLYSRIK